MFRSGAARTVGRSLASIQTPQYTSRAFLRTRAVLNGRVWSSRTGPSPATSLHKPSAAALVRYASGVAPIDMKPNKEEEAKLAQQVLKSDPENVTTSSSVHPVFGEVQTPEPEHETDMMAGIRSDVVRPERSGNLDLERS